MVEKPLYVTFDDVQYRVVDWHYVGVHRKQIALNSRQAEGRAFVPEKPHQVRMYPFSGGINYQRSDPETLAQQFKNSVPGRWTR